MITRELHFKKPEQVIVDDEVETVDDCRVFDSVIASNNAEKKWKKSRKQQNLLIKNLAVHANVSPHCVYKCFFSLVHNRLILSVQHQILKIF